MKQYPFSWMLRKFHPEHLPRIGKHAAMQHVTRGLRHLCQVMRTEISPDHFRHPNNEVPHFPGAIGSWDTFPIRVFSGRGRYQPKYKNAVVKCQGITTHMGLFAYVSGPHPGQMSDTTLARKYRPLLRASDTLLADLAYLSVPNCLKSRSDRSEQSRDDQGGWCPTIHHRTETELRTTKRGRGYQHTGGKWQSLRDWVVPRQQHVFLSLEHS